METNFADMFEAIVDLVPDRTACVIVGDGRRTYARARGPREPHGAPPRGGRRRSPATTSGSTRTTASSGSRRCSPSYKIRAVPININYRYVEAELEYLCTNADLVALVAQQEFAPRIAAIREQPPEAARTS